MYTELLRLLSSHQVRLQEPLKNHTTFRIGGPADCMVFPETTDDIVKVLKFCRQNHIFWFVFGLGINILVGDKGIRGVAIKIGERFSGITINENKLFAYGGSSLADCAQTAALSSLGGMEFASGIPGSIAGAVVMNAGAYDGEMKDLVVEVEVINAAGQISIIKNEEINFSYRSSCFSSRQDLIIKVTLQLYNEEKPIVLAKMKNLAEQRKAKQPLDYPSAGSAFKRPKGLYVAPLLEEMGLKGYQVGGAQVSDKHAGFIINTGNATAMDVKLLIADIQAKVFKQHGIMLEPEMKMVGEF